MNIQTILRILKKHVNGYLTEVGRINTVRPDAFEVKVIYPTDEEFQEYIFKMMKKMGLTVYMDEDSPYKIIYLIQDGFKMPVITSFSLKDNIYNKGKVECSVWINEHVKEPVHK